MCGYGCGCMWSACVCVHLSLAVYWCVCVHVCVCVRMVHANKSVQIILYIIAVTVCAHVYVRKLIPG